MNQDAYEFTQYLAWQREYEVLPSLNWVCHLKRKLFSRSPVSDLAQTTILNNFTAFWARKKCYGSYRDAVFDQQLY